MSKLFPLIFLVSTFSLFGISWIIYSVDPDTASWYFFVLLVGLAFLAIFGYLGLLIYFFRTRFVKRFDAAAYFKMSFKVSFFVAAFSSVVLTLKLLKILSVFNLILVICALALFAVYSFWGGKKN